KVPGFRKPARRPDSTWLSPFLLLPRSCATAGAAVHRLRERGVLRGRAAGWQRRAAGGGHCARMPPSHGAGAGACIGHLCKGSAMSNQLERAAGFRALHAGPGSFVIPNVWDGGSAAIMAGLGFRALATSSAACAATLGRLDGQITRAEALAHARQVIAATA